MNNEATEDDRPRAMLTPADRQFLLGEKEYEHRQTAFDRRKAIRDRVVASLSDFSLLFGYLSKHEREKIADEISMPDWADAPDHSVMAGPPDSVVHTLAFLCLLHEDTEAFQQTVGQGAAGAIQKERGGRWDVDVDIDPERIPAPPNLEAIDEKLQDGLPGELNGLEAQRVIDELAKRHALGDVRTTIARPTPQEHIQRGISEGTLTFDRLKRLKDEEVVGIEAFPDPREVEARQARTPYDDE
jgi:hypothetical protein